MHLITLMLLIVVSSIAFGQEAKATKESISLEYSGLSWKDNAGVVLPESMYVLGVTSQKIDSKIITVFKIGYGIKSQTVKGVSVDGSLFKVTGGARYQDFIDENKKIFYFAGIDAGYAMATIGLSAGGSSLSADNSQLVFSPCFGAGVQLNDKFSAELGYQYNNLDFDGVKMSGGVTFSAAYHY